MYSYSFEKLEVWQDARKLNLLVYQVTATFPPGEKFGLTNQIRRAAVSISSNIAEGTGRRGSFDKAYFFQIAYGSSLEVLSQCILANDLNLITTHTLESLRIQIEKITNKLYSLRQRELENKGK